MTLKVFHIIFVIFVVKFFFKFMGSLALCVENTDIKILFWIALKQ